MKNGEGDTVALADEVYQANNTMFTGPYVRAQYVWGPGDNGVDELLCQLDPRDTSQSSYNTGGGKPWYVMTDAQGDVVSVAHVPPGTNQTAEVGGQWTYSPYGEVLTYEKLHPHPVVVFGHKTLAIDRLDGQAVNWDFEEGSVSENRRLVPGARNIAYARNRTLDISRGRWLQQDPNASGLTVITELSTLGLQNYPRVHSADLADRIRDGLLLPNYCAQSPVQRIDSGGLFLGIIGIGVANGIGSYLDMKGYIGDARRGYGMRYFMQAELNEYGLMQDEVTDWASDWGASDSQFKDGYHFTDPLQAYSEYEANAEADDNSSSFFSSFNPIKNNNPIKAAMKHGGLEHQKGIYTLMGKGRAAGVRRGNVRVNQPLIDPKTGQKISAERPDYFGFAKPNKVIIGESAVTQSASAAAARVKRFGSIYRKRGFEVDELPITGTAK